MTRESSRSDAPAWSRAVPIVSKVPGVPIVQDVESLHRFKKLETQGSLQMFNGSMEDKLDWNFTFEDSRSIEGQDRLDVQLASQA